ncbi:MAG: type II secretion system protein [Clostridia bacterium]|nr:type II secretion system protein [Clostridia bacterium]MDD4049224.1 type II secretion system protein [Clostridia bacterium]
MHIIKDTRGFTLIEVLIAAVIFATVLPLSMYFVDCIRINNKTKIQQEANNLAQRYMEEYKGKSVGDIIADLDSNATEVREGKEYTIDEGNGFEVNVELEYDEMIVSKMGRMEIEKRLVFGDLVIIVRKESGDFAWIIDNGESYELKIEVDINGSPKLTISDSNSVSKGSTVLDNIDPNPRILEIVVEEDVNLTFDVYNEMASKFIICKDIDDSATFNLNINLGEVEVRDLYQIDEYERGADITVTVEYSKYEDEFKELAKMSQTRKTRT